MLEGLEASSVERELELAILEAHLVVESGVLGDGANLVQVLTLTASGDVFNTDGDLTVAVVVNLGLGLLVIFARKNV